VKILLDECVPKRPGRFLLGHEVTTTPDAGWAGTRNGDPLRRAAGQFEIFITVDRNLSFQQNLANLPLPVIVLHSRSNKLRDLKEHISTLQQLLKSPLTREVFHIKA
jgi:hypothetical protein